MPMVPSPTRPAPHFTGIDSFTYLANNGEQNTNVATVTLTVTARVPARPDLQLRINREAAYSGDNVYSSDGANQVKTMRVTPGAAASFLFHVENDGATADSFRVRGNRRQHQLAGGVSRYRHRS